MIILRLSYDEVEKAVEIANEILEKQSTKKISKRITITSEDIEAFGLLLEMFNNADEATSENWIDDEDREKISRLQKKIYGK